MSERTEPEFVSGLFVKTPEPSQPNFIIAKLGIRREELIEWLLQKSDEWVNIDIKEARSGKWYAQVDTWEPRLSKKPLRTRSKSAVQNEYEANERKQDEADERTRDECRKEATADERFDDDIPF